MFTDGGNLSAPYYSYFTNPLVVVTASDIEMTGEVKGDTQTYKVTQPLLEPLVDGVVADKKV